MEFSLFKKKEVRHVEVHELGKVEIVDFCGVGDNEKRQLVIARTDVMRGSYPGAVSEKYIRTETGTPAGQRVLTVPRHDVMVNVLTENGMNIGADLTNKREVNAALTRFCESRKS